MKVFSNFHEKEEVHENLTYLELYKREPKIAPSLKLYFQTDWEEEFGGKFFYSIRGKISENNITTHDLWEVVNMC